MKKINSFLPNMDIQSVNLLRHIGLSSIYKALSILIGIVLVPLSINYLGNEKYGLWLTIFSFIGWFNFVDFGIGNGLRNKLSEALANNNIKLAKYYVSTTYVTLIAISLLVTILLISVFPFVDWANLFNYDRSEQSIRRLIFIAFLLFSVNLSLKNINSLFFADQRPSVPELLSFLAQLVTISAIFILMKQKEESLFLYGIIVFSSQILILFLSTVIAFTGKYKVIRPQIGFFRMEYVRDITNLGGKFFLIQISASLVFTTDNFIINQVLGATEVTSYNIAYKYFMLSFTLMILISGPYWSAFTKAIALQNYEWIESSLKLLRRISYIVIGITIIMIFAADKIYELWVGDKVEIPFLLSLFMGMNIIVRAYIYPKIMFLNGSGKIQIELYLGLSLAIINIPLSIFLASNMNLGITGVILSTLLIGIIELFVYPIQVNKILNKTAHGIWNK